MELLVEIYGAVPPTFEASPWMWWLGKALKWAGTIMLGMVLGMNLERRRGQR